MDSSTLTELLAIEHDGWRSLCDGTGDRFYADLMTEDGVMVLAHGQTMDRSEVAVSLAQAPPWHTYAITQERLIPLGSDAAVLLYSATATRGDEPPFTALMTSVYVRRGAGWALACYQQTPVPPTQEAGQH